MMLLARLIDRFLGDEAIILIDHRGTLHRCGSSEGEPTLIVRLTTSSIQRRLLLNPQVAAGEGYMDGEILFEKGDLRQFMRLIFSRQEVENEFRATAWLPYRSFFRSVFARLYQLNFLKFASRNVKHHYDIGNSIYEKFLGPTMQYSCAYFPALVLPQGRAAALARYQERNVQDLDSAQRRKVELLIKKLKISDGMRVLDVGCGWGGLAIEIARVAKVHVLGISLSLEQINYAREKAAAEGLSERVSFEILDYRELTDKFDRIVSVGMFEHVGKSFYRAFFRHMNNALKADGIFVLHTIGRIDEPGGTNPWLRKYIFPGGYIPALSEILKASEPTHLILTDVEILRLHYALTLREWSRRFADSSKGIEREMGERFIKMWQFYLTSSEMAFVYGRFVNFQLQFAKDRFALPITRDYLCG